MLASATDGWSTLLLLLLLAIGGWVDLRENRIPNLIVLYGIVVAVALHGLVSGAEGVSTALTGMLTAGALLLPWCLLGGMGAGDVKLMAMVGAFLGPEGAAAAVVLTLLAGLVLGVSVLAAWKISSRSRRARDPLAEPRLGGSVCFPYAPAMVAGTVAWLWWHAELQPAVQMVAMLWTG